MSNLTETTYYKVDGSTYTDKGLALATAVGWYLTVEQPYDKAFDDLDADGERLIDELDHADAWWGIDATREEKRRALEAARGLLKRWQASEQFNDFLAAEQRAESEAALNAARERGEG